jgi:hypothetical protein
MNKIVNVIDKIDSNLTGLEGYGVTLTAPNTVGLSGGAYAEPYGVIVQGCDSLTPGIYPSPVAEGSLVVMPQIGDLAWVCISCYSSDIKVGDWLGQKDGSGQFYLFGDDLQEGYRIWGRAMTEVVVAYPASGRCLMRFQPEFIFHWSNP